MKAKRNTNGLKENAKAKRKEAFDKVDEGIKTLLREKRAINFNRVAEASGVSKAWLYKEPDIKARIEHLRNQSAQGKKLPRKISATEASTKALNAALQARVKKLDAENRELRRQNEVAYGQVIRVRELERQIERLMSENKELKGQSAIQPVGEVGFEEELQKLGIRINPTLQRLISGTPSGIVESAIQALHEAQGKNEVKNPAGYLNKAISEAWNPNESLQENDELTQFNEWWPMARKQGLVIASEQIDGVLHICTAGQKWVPFSEARESLNLAGVQYTEYP